MWNDFLKFLNDNKDALGILFGSGVVLALLGGIFRFVRWLIKESRMRKTRSDENFPFKIIPPNSNVAKEILGGNDNDLLADRNIPYQQRVAGRNIRREIEDLLTQNHWVLITGKTGLGKTREAVHVAESLNKEGWTVIYLTRERWLSAPSKLPTGVPERKLLFIFDDLNRKIYASRAERSPQAENSLLQPLYVPLQTRIHETLKIFETLCGKNEIMVIATARNEKFSEFADEPSEWDKLEINKFDDLWKKFSFFHLPEADDEAEINLLSSTVRTTDIKANPFDFPVIAKKNDGTFSNLVENLRTVRHEHTSLQENTFRDTLKGTWGKRYQDATTKNIFAKYYYDSIDLARTIGLDISLFNIFSIANILAEKEPIRIHIVKNFRTLQDLVKKENILNPRDGQIEAKGYKVEVRVYLPRLYKHILYNANKTKSKLINLSRWLDSIFFFIPKSSLSIEEVSALEKFWALFFGLGYKLYRLGIAYGDLRFQEIEVLCYRKSINLSKWSVLYSRRIRLGIRQWVELSRSYWGQQKYSDAEAASQEAIKLDPKDAGAWTGLGHIYHNQKRNEDAIDSFQKAIKFDPKFATPWNGLGIVFIDLGQLENAIHAFTKALKIDPNQDIYWYNLAYTYTIQKQYQKAHETYLKAIKKLPNNGLLISRLAGVLYKLGQNKEANEQILQARPLMESEVEYTRAAYELNCGKFEEALDLFRIALKKDQVSQQWARQDPDFDNLRDDPRFKELVGLE